MHPGFVGWCYRTKRFGGASSEEVTQSLGRGLVARSTGTAGLAHSEFPKPPVLLVHGTADPVVPIAALHMAESELKRLGVEVTTHISYGIPHSVDPVGLRLGREFVANAFIHSS
jgi:phospholipase/carboxylesterase